MKQMISVAMAAFAALCLSWNAAAFQPQHQEKFKSEKIAFITTELELTPAEAEKFWPVYNQMAAEQKEALDATMKAFKELNEAIKSEADDATLSRLTHNYAKANSAFQAIDDKYVDQFTKVIPAKKVAKLYLCEEKFRRQQIHRLGKGMKGGFGKDGAPGKDVAPVKGERPQKPEKNK